MLITKKEVNWHPIMIFFLSISSAKAPPYKLAGILIINSTMPIQAKVAPEPVSSYNHIPVAMILKFIANIAVTALAQRIL